MAWQRLRITVRAEEADAIGDALLEAGALSVDAGDAAFGTDEEKPIFGEPGADARAWPETGIAALFPENADVSAALADACDAIGLPLPPAEIDPVLEQDWVRQTQNQFSPIPIGRRLWIVPTWHEPPEDPKAVVIRLDPGLAFGTGSHPTTRLCLEWLDRYLEPGVSVLDYGCGSGILAIAARKLGAGAVTGVDVDPNAVIASRDNATLNDAAIEVLGPDDRRASRYDVVIANILANPLRVLAPLLAASVRPGGVIVLSGILEPQQADVVSAYSQWIRFEAPLADDGWMCLWGIRH